MVDSGKSGPVPRYYQVMEFLRECIRSGVWVPGTSLPSERERCERYGMNHMAARQAVAELVEFTGDMHVRARRASARMLDIRMWPVDQATAMTCASNRANRSTAIPPSTMGRPFDALLTRCASS